MKNKNIKSIGLVILVSIITAAASFFILKNYFGPGQDVYVADQPAQIHYASYSNASMIKPNNFTKAAQEVVPFTVHINTKVPPKKIHSQSRNFWHGIPFMGPQYSPGKYASGSGVIISADGYIVTNNHVIEGADEIAVTLNNKKTYMAKVVGADSNTDLAVLKIDAKNLPYTTFGNSDNVKIGQWVLACGYPLNLQTTVTAGIISAKSRSIAVNERSLNPIETYIQTDAAVNPGNSGGPLVNTDGQLIGINSAIASPTGSFAGYSYAVPSNLVRKVTRDIIKYGKVQRAFLGILLDSKDRKSNAFKAVFNKAGKDVKNGVEVSGISPKGSAGDAGIQEGDRIIGIDNFDIITQSDLLGILARHRPGDKVEVTFLRDGKKHQVDVLLKNKKGTTGIVKHSVLDALGAEFRALTEKQAQSLGISGGVLVGKIGDGLINSQTDMQSLFIIVSVGNYSVSNTEDLKKAFEKQGNNVILKGFYIDRNGRRITNMMYYAIHDVKSGMVN